MRACGACMRAQRQPLLTLHKTACTLIALVNRACSSLESASCPVLMSIPEGTHPPTDTNSIDLSKELVFTQPLASPRAFLTWTGMNKMVINHLERLFVTSDASTIVTELEINHPAARLLVHAAKAQEQEIGDGTNLVRTADRDFTLLLPSPCLLLS